MHTNDHTLTRKKVAQRVKIALGQLHKVLSMVEEDAYCVDIIHQSQAIQSALKQVDTLLLDNHLKTCVVSQIKEGKQEAIKEVMEVFKRQK